MSPLLAELPIDQGCVWVAQGNLRRHLAVLPGRGWRLWAVGQEVVELATTPCQQTPMVPSDDDTCLERSHKGLSTNDWSVPSPCKRAEGLTVVCP